MRLSSDLRLLNYSTWLRVDSGAYAGQNDFMHIASRRRVGFEVRLREEITGEGQMNDEQFLKLGI
jgi:hypothetical protein